MRSYHFASIGTLVVICLVLTFAAMFGLMSLRLLSSFSMAGYDLTNMNQAMWNTAHGRPFVFTYAYPLTHRLGVHIEPIFLVIAPLYRIIPRPETLLWIQVVVVALGAMPAYWLARSHLQSTAAGIVFALAYLFFPALQSGILYEFHPSTLAASLWLFALYFLDQDQKGAFVAFSLLALSTKEEMGLILALLGGYAILRKRFWGIGLTFLALGMAWFFIGVFLIQPRFSSTGENVQFFRYVWLGSTPSEMVTTFFTRPDKIWLQIWDRAQVGDYFLRLLAPVGFTALLDPLTIMLAAPSFAVNLLSSQTRQARVEEFHYAAPIVPFVVVSGIYGVERLARRLRAILGRWRETSKEAIYSQLALVLSLIVLASSSTYQYYRGFFPWSRAFSLPSVTAHNRRLQSLIQMVPPEASLLVQPNIAPFFSARSELYGLPTHINRVDYLFLDVSSLIELPNLHQQLQTLVAPQSAFGLVAAADGYLVLSRNQPPGQPLQDAFFDFARADVSDIQYPTQVRFGDDLEFLGYDLIPYREGEVEIDLFFRPLRQIETDYLVALYLLDELGQFLGATTQEPATTIWYPTSRWLPDEVVRVHVEAVPWNTRPLPSYNLAIGILVRPTPWDVSARLPPTILNSSWQARLPADGTLLGIAGVEKVWDIAEGGPKWRQFEVPRSARPLEARFADGIVLSGIELPKSSLRPGDELKTTLYWQAAQDIEASYTVFVHLVDSSGQLRSQSDHIPDSTLPTHAWVPGEVVADHHMIHLEETIDAGEYTLVAGVYDTYTQERLSLAEPAGPFSEDDLVLIGTIAIR